MGKPDNPPLGHQNFLKNLSLTEKQALVAKSDRAGLAHLIGHWGAILLVGLAILAEPPFWPLLLPIQGILIIFNFTLLHECTHKTPFKSGWINEVVGRIAGISVGLPFLWFRYFHMAHHKYTNDPEHDPELNGAAIPQNLREYLLHVSGFPVWKSQALTLIKLAIGRQRDGFIPPSALRRTFVEAGLIVILYTVIAFYSITYSSMLLKVWIIPILLGQPFLRLYLLAEHANCPTVPDMFKNSRTMTTNWVIRFLAWNMPYHAEHHTYPGVPFHLLPRLHHLVANQLETTENGYFRFHRSYFHDVNQHGVGDP